MNAYKALLIFIVMNLAFGFAGVLYETDWDTESTSDGFGFNATSLQVWNADNDNLTAGVEGMEDSDQEDKSFFKAITEVGKEVVSTLGAFWEFTKFIGRIVVKGLSLQAFDTSLGNSTLERFGLLMVNLARIIANLILSLVIITKLFIGHSGD